jgi:hypothetical protein
MFILFRFIRDKSGLIRGSRVSSATVDMPAILIRFSYCLNKIALINCTVRSQFRCRYRGCSCLWLRIIWRRRFWRVWIFIYNRTACVSVIIITVLILTILSFLLPVMTILIFRIRNRVLLFWARILSNWAGILFLWTVVFWLRFRLYSEIFDYHLKGPVGSIHWVWLIYE